MVSSPVFRLSPAARAVFRLSRAIADGAAAIVLAPQCAACRTPLDEPTRGAVCPACWRSLTPTSPFGLLSFPPSISMAAAIGPYDGRLKDIIHALKYDGRPTIARHLARYMRLAGAEVLEGADAVVPVPLHRSRERSRGFNQARELARHFGLPMADLLVRTRRTVSQADLPAAQRQANVRDAFALRLALRSRGTGKGPDGLVLVLVDDVSTTGATLNACAAPLLDAGAREVRALTAARAVVRTSAASEPRERSGARGPRE